MKDYQETNVIVDIQEGEAWCSISIEGLCCGLKKEYGVKPKIGDRLTLYTKGDRFGTIRGMEINEKRIFWIADDELQVENE